ncbi:hypothetical protein CXG81DRAFT_28669 [Caulochytrium protostelioides]|uniref:RING-type domain-containing protein n=1 Tax=Caulochytrium protostelioides TaxID=1555241 RepID=A0A4P9X158_9FUNG|nr:hypothetical protein CXG81DRAFT_28669 [Caulochytrium protostelioides]|eukprot:RKO98508.1 hypothetical protein CXG81DRAFT_28669 [Caulochytrium protostelioides]
MLDHDHLVADALASHLAAGPPGIATPGRPDDAAFADGAPSASAEPLNTRPPPTATIPVTADLVKQYELESAYECTICSEDVMDVGPHVASALRCGHTFGDACIRRWIKTRTAKKGEKARCPACMAPCVARDLRRILPKATIVRSDASANELVDKYQAAQQTIAALQVQLNKYQSLYQAEAEMGRLFHAEIVQLKQQLATRDHVKAKQGNCTQASDAIPELGHHSVTLPLATFGKPVVGSLKTLHLVDGHPMISQAIGLRHGLCRYDRYEPDATPRACTLHHHIIRDCDYHPKLGLALTVSTDMYAKLTDVRTSFRETAATKLATPLLSCTFGPAGRDYAMFVGGQDGAVYELDQRQPGRVVGRVDVSFAGHPGPRSRVLSLRALPLSSSSSSPPAILYAVPRGVGILRLNAGGRHDVHGSVTGRSGPRRPEPPNAPPHLTCLGLARLPPSDLVDPHGGPLVWSATWQAGQHVAHTFHRISPDQPYTTPGLIDSLVGHPRRPGGPIWRPETGAAVLVRRDFAFRPPSMARAAADPTMPYCVLYPGRRTPHGGADGLYMSAEDFDDVYTPTSHLSETGQPMIAVAYAQSGSDAVLATLHEGGIVVTTSV